MKLLLLFLLPLATSFTLLPSTSVSSEYIPLFIPFNLDTLLIHHLSIYSLECHSHQP